MSRFVQKKLKTFRRSLLRRAEKIPHEKLKALWLAALRFINGQIDSSAEVFRKAFASRGKISKRDHDLFFRFLAEQREIERAISHVWMIEERSKRIIARLKSHPPDVEYLFREQAGFMEELEMFRKKPFQGPCENNISSAIEKLYFGFIRELNLRGKYSARTVQRELEKQESTRKQFEVLTIESHQPTHLPVVTFSRGFRAVNCSLWPESESRKRARQATTIIRRLYENWRDNSNKPMSQDDLLKGVRTHRLDKALSADKYPQTFKLVEQDTEEKTGNRTLWLSKEYDYKVS